MAKWVKLPQDPLYAQPDQAAFLDARRKRLCSACNIHYKSNEEEACPTCHKPGIRVFDRLTIIAGRRWGKSRIGSIAGVEEACLPSTIGWACAPTNPKLHRYVIPAFQQLIPPEWVAEWSSEYLDLRLKNGSLIHFQTLEDPDQGRGQGLDWLWIDEVCELTEAHWDVIRPSLYDRQGVAFFTTSPKSYDWVYEKLYKRALDNHPGYWACHAKTIENPKFREPQYKAALELERATMPDAMFRQEYEADFVTFAGAVYGDMLLPQILRTDEDVKKLIPEWPAIAPWRAVVIGIDTGADHPFGAVKLVSTEKGLVAVEEYLEREKAFIQHTTELKRLAGKHPVRWAINKNEKQPMIELGQHWITCNPAENDQHAGIERVKSWLHNHELWFVENKVPKTVQQFKAYRWADPRRDQQYRDKAAVYKRNDELPDCVRYAVMIWPQLPKPAKPSTERDISKLPDDLQATIQRMRRIDETQKEDLGKASGIGDFWS
jgi:hypothetical protein